MRISLLFVIALSIAPAWAQPPITFTQFGTADTEGALAVAVDAGGIYVGANTSGAFPGYTNLGSGDAFVRKYTSGGTELWTRQFGNAASNEVNDLAVTGNALYVVGDNNPGAFVAKFDLAGNALWTREFNGQLPALATGVSVTADAVYVAGGIDFKAFLRKYDLNGNELWERQFEGPFFGLATAYGVKATSSGIYVSGETTGPFGTDVDVFVRKFSPNGREIWKKQFGSTNWYEHGVALAATETAVYVGGYTEDNWDAFVRKHDVNGNEIWTQKFTTPTEDFVSGFAATDEAVYINGYLRSSGGPYEAFVRKIAAADGSNIWLQQFGTPSDDTTGRLTVFDQEVYVVGRTTGTLPGQTSAGGSDAYLGRMSEQ